MLYQAKIPCAVLSCVNGAIYIGYIDEYPDEIMFLCEKHKDQADDLELLESEVKE